MTLRTHMTPEQVFDSLLIYLQEYYPHIDIDSLYPIALYQTGVEDQPADKNVTITVTFNYKNFQPQADPCATGCQYAKDVTMPEHSCGSACQYKLKALSE